MPASLPSTRRTKASSLSAPFLTTLRSGSLSGISVCQFSTSTSAWLSFWRMRLGRAEAELVVVVRGIAGIQHLEPLLHREARGHDEDRAREVLVALGVGDACSAPAR